MNAVKEVELVEKSAEPLAMQTTNATGPIAMFERLIHDPTADVEKLEKLIALHERMVARSAQEQFNAAMADAQTEMRPISADAENPQTRSRYASYAQLDRAIRPIYTRHGFGISYDTGDSPLADHARVLAYVTHRGGHDRTYKIDMPNDGKGAKGGDVMTKTHAQGAAMSYGMRYLLKMIFNVAVGEDDVDGNRVTSSHGKAESDAPTGYEDWQNNAEAVAVNGWPKLAAAFSAAPAEYRKRATGYDKAWWNTLKAKAEAVTKGGAR